MKKKNKLLALLLAIAFIFTLCGTAVANDDQDITILYTNDVHCAVDKNIGYAGLAAYKADILKTGAYVTLVDNGDAIQGQVLGSLSNGAYIVDIMNAMGYEAAVPGNHEFDYGMENFLDLSKVLQCGYVCCNFLDLRTGKPVFDPYQMITYGNTKVAYVGISTPESISKSTPKYFQDTDGNFIYGFCAGNNGQDLYNAVQDAIDAAKAAGADYVVAVGHCGIEEQSAPWRSTDIIQHVSGLSAFIDGHSHSIIPEQDVPDQDGKTVVLTSSGTELSAIGKLVIKADGTVTSELVTDYTNKDDAITAFIDEIKAENQVKLATVVAKSEVTLSPNNADGTRAIRSQETNIGDLVADAFRTIGEADIGLVNGGDIRADINAGDITYENIVNVLPFNNSLCVVEATGQEIVDALEMASRYCPYESGGFLHVSGLKYAIDTTVPSFVKVDDNKMFLGIDGPYRVKDVQVLNRTGKYEPILPANTYTVASHNYLLKSGGDGNIIFADNQLIKDCTALETQALIDYITQNLKGDIPADYAASQGRISIRYKVSYLFTDVADDAWYESNVQSCYDQGIMNGVTGTTFAPDASMSRAMLVTMLYRLAGSPAVGGKVADTFADCTEDQWYADAVLWAHQNQIVNGVASNAFAPLQLLTRQEMASILYRYALYKGASVQTIPPLDYADAAAIADWARAGVAYCTSAGLMNGIAGSVFDPAATASRAMGAAVMSRLEK
ncbi:MAG TPA: 5'-nucleotidase C-terminal domain-containing protein [Syntrophomonas sp.]|nr:5'-nucleotidase C-terminal domain-containing protein [Syntrophomonas sp.]